VKRRGGFALVELLVALLIAGIIGIALARLIINQARFIGVQDGMMRARSAARAALNVMQDELRMVSDSGLRAASQDSITVRVPFLFGIACGYTSGRTIVSELPADSAAVAGAVASGMAWRDSLGSWRFVEPATLASGAPGGSCWSNSPVIQVIGTSGWSARMGTGSGTAPTVNAPVYFYQLVTYRFGPSVDQPGKRALWRVVPGASLNEELVAPFDTSARFEFLVGSVLTSQTTPPGNLESVLGVRVRLIALSDQVPQGRVAPLKFDLTTSLQFRNHVN